MNQQAPAKRPNPLLPGTGLVADVSAVVALVLTLTTTSATVVAVAAGVAVIASAGYLWSYRDVPLGGKGFLAVVALAVAVATASIALTRLFLDPAVTGPSDTEGGTPRSTTSRPAAVTGTNTTGQPTTSTDQAGPAERSLLSLTPQEEDYVHLPITINGTTYSQAKVGKPFSNYAMDRVVDEEYTVPPAVSTIFRSRIGVADDAPTGASVTFTITVDGRPVATKVVTRGTIDDIEADISGQTRFGISAENESSEPALAAWIDPVIVSRT
ncbi:NPCBM/NEW2 domain-containing protein [Saccharothrix syringae]|uniref:Glycosyl hydrolase family 98 putative carbohydrate-binding module domain-containing protein n=1 Tax=Saccharothrix syringae TaxID=103733 RepID=A0A5Q0GZ60_SACSY|nr:NPCBM/NEW2 domain-containing protein [Saccharothrix syringae]QFZ18672.1 hypothetical protein EKG83_15435 [Saccharothrix syringae]